jgi:hypothetical protein
MSNPPPSTLPWALRLLIQGRHVRRRHWANGMTVALAGPHVEVVRLFHNGTPSNALPYGYHLTKHDILATDWELSS